MEMLLHDGWEFSEAGKKRWHPARVPGCVHLDLRGAQLIPDPFWGAHEQKLAWIEEKDWEYRTVFQVPPAMLKEEELDLVAEGLDTLATLTLNGRRIAKTENMFCGYDNDVGRATFRMPLRDHPNASAADWTFRFGSMHPSGFNMMMCDGSVQHVSYSIDPLVFRSAGNRFTNSAWPATP